MDSAFLRFAISHAIFRKACRTNVAVERQQLGEPSPFSICATRKENQAAERALMSLQGCDGEGEELLHVACSCL
jgi:hypothetical protein